MTTVGKRLAMAGALGLLATAGSMAEAQDATYPVPLEEYVTTRQALMISNDDAMYEMETAIMNNAVDMAVQPLWASAVAASLRAFAVMLPPETNYAVVGDPANPDIMSSTSPKVWEDMAGFQAELHRIADIAEQASYAGTAEEFAPLVAQLREGCTSCHDAYLAYDNSVPATP